ncbi:MAG: LysE family translocator [Pseudomonadales bacterium]|nr:LysE family translocator [Pseudomonadales bacterium]
MTLEFLVTSLVVVLLPGTGVIYTLAIGLGQGFKSSVAAALGCTLGIVPAALASIFGLAALLHTSALAFQIVKFLGVLYLFYMAWGILKDKGAMEVSESRQTSSLAQVAITGTLLNVLNPKLSLFFLAFLPQFISPASPNATAELFGLAAVFMLMTLAVFVCYGAFAALARDYVIRRPSVMRWIRRFFAGTFGFLGARLALSD